MNIFMKLILLLSLTISANSFAQYASSEDLRQRYPTIDDGSTRSENKEILCPFWRLIERSGSLDALDKAKGSDVVISILNIARKAKEFGCKFVECASVATLVSAGQQTHIETMNIASVNITKLHNARGIAHDCGLTFEKGGAKVSNKRRSQTLSRLEALSVKNQGRLVLADLMQVKKQICSDEGVEMSAPGKLEVGLIFSFLGGKDRGFIEYTDVERFLNAKMPLTKSIDKI